MARVLLAGVLVALAGGRGELEVPGDTVEEVLRSLADLYPRLRGRIFGEGGRLRPDIYVAVNDVDIRLLDGLRTKVGRDDRVLVLAWIHPG